MNKATDENFAEILKESFETPVILKMFTSTCGPCKVYAPIVEAVAAERPDLSFYEINLEENIIGSKLRVQAVPTTLIFKKGQEVKRFLGVKSKKALEAELDF
jgi:thioredoxin-like negative regulator of GroEL